MSSAATSISPMELRQDIHNSCGAIETLLTVLNDYCESASDFAAVQKKLAKALRDAAALKTNAQFASKAFDASSAILEISADVDSKFAKLAAKEFQSIAAEVKKWLKKLAKDEKAHDERMNESKACIKEAGQVYEIKSKKGAKDASEEHARYINRLSVIGLKVSREQYDHAIHVTQQNTMVTFSVAAGLSRIADAEWTRTCECMRRISPNIGSLGEWRSLCEGAWTGPLRNDLPDMSSEISPPQGSVTQTAVSEWGQTCLSTPVRRMLPIPPGHSPGSVSAPVTASLEPPRSPFTTPNQIQGSINSVTTLSAFPFPPTHFPVPLVMNEAELQQQQAKLQNLQAVHSRAGNPNPTQSNGVLAPPVPILSDSPVAELQEALPLSIPKSSRSLRVSQALSSSHPSSALAGTLGAPPKLEPSTSDDKGAIKPMTSGGDPKKPRRPSLVARVPPLSDRPIRPIPPFKRAEHSSTEKEFGAFLDSNESASKSQSVDATKKSLDCGERGDSTHSTGGNVAALRNRYTRTVETASQGPKDIPRLPMSVSEIASRYQPADEPLSPQRTVSSIVDRSSPDTPIHTSARDSSIDGTEIWGRRQRIEELAELELKEKEFELGKREHHRLHSRPELGNSSDGPKGPRDSPFQHKRGSQSATHIDRASPSSSRFLTLPRLSTSHSPLLPSKGHAPFCGCNTCSVSKYKMSDVPTSLRDLRPPKPPIRLRPEKPKSWLRRLSMPSVSAAFSLDAKKNASAVSLKAGHENGRLQKRNYEQGISNRTLTAIGR